MGMSSHVAMGSRISREKLRKYQLLLLLTKVTQLMVSYYQVLRGQQ